VSRQKIIENYISYRNIKLAQSNLWMKMSTAGVLHTTLHSPGK